MVHSTRDDRRLTPCPFPLIVPAHRVVDRNGLAQAAEQNSVAGNAVSAAILEYIHATCASCLDDIESGSKVWYQWRSVGWSPAVVVDVRSDQIVIESKRPTKSRQCGPHLGSVRHEGRLYCHWFELAMRRNRTKPDPLNTTHAFEVLQSELESLGIDVSVDDVHMMYWHLGQKLLRDTMMTSEKLIDPRLLRTRVFVDGREIDS